MRIVNPGQFFFGLLLMSSGALYIGEQLGYVPPSLKWGMPLVVVTFGLSLVVDSFKRRNSS
ncbi:hypothetical protein [Bordetella bronchialis]|uniref:DUF5668 domain-containing protein n=1 Tax=Bordetella bronchialis TaxID=463025 RepID=A0A193FUY3_9BORD|nr:hypothetical protein [Bordetella bronchialis]ANN71567.1 hypothetical protein BAU08_09645 [Bordetella bronchialis]